MNLSPANSPRISNRGQRDDNFALENMSWLLGGSGGTHTPVTSLHSYGSINCNSSDEKLRSSSIKFSERIVEIPSVNPSDVLSRSVDTCLEDVFGLYGIEIWQFDSTTGKLINEPVSQSGLHIRRIPQEADHDSPSYDPESRDAFERLIYKSRLDYLSPEPVESGVSLVGALWSETHTPNALISSGVKSMTTSVHKRFGLLAGLQPVQTSNATESIVWRMVDDLVTDPNQPYDERLHQLSKAGFKLAAGIPVDVRGFRGIIIFYANPHSERRKLCQENNVRLISQSAEYIGAAAALQHTLKAANRIRTNLPILNWKRLRVKILAVVRFQRPLTVRRIFSKPLRKRVGSFALTLERMKSFNREQSFQMLSDAAVEIKKKAKATHMKWLIKLKGGNASIPPSMPPYQCLWAFVGIFTTILILTRIDRLITEKSSGQLSILMAPIGALTTTQWNLTAAPASQPRNAILSQIVALFTAFSLHQISSLDPTLRCALAPSITAALTARFGIIHAPSGAAAVVFSMSRYNLEHNLLFLAGIFISIGAAIAMNNLSDHRQYPTYY